jgi:hypothetical protein
MEPLRPIDLRRPREVDPVTVPVRLSPLERDQARERREQARKRRATPPEPPGETAAGPGGHVDLRA